jgi:hypothetical protein
VARTQAGSLERLNPRPGEPHIVTPAHLDLPPVLQLHQCMPVGVQVRGGLQEGTDSS